MRKLVAQRRKAAEEEARAALDVAAQAEVDAGWEESDPPAPVVAAALRNHEAPSVDPGAEEDGVDDGWDEFLTPEEEARAVAEGRRPRKRPPSRERREEKKRRRSAEKQDRAEERARAQRAMIEAQRERGREKRRAHREAERLAAAAGEPDEPSLTAVEPAPHADVDGPAEAAITAPGRVERSKPRPRPKQVRRAAAAEQQPARRPMPWGLIAFVLALGIGVYLLMK